MADKVIISKAKITSLADAVREKTGSTDAMTWDSLASAVSELGTGGDDAYKDFVLGVIDRSVTEIPEEICESLTSVGAYTFYSCSGLTSVKFPLVTDIGINAFGSCTGLTSIDFPSVTNIGGFFACTSLTSISFPIATTINTSAFSRCTGLTSIDLPAATSIGDSAFYGCTGLTSIDLPAATSIGGSAFYGCTGLTSIDIPMVTSIGASAFYGCTSLKTIEIGSSSKVCSLKSTNAIPTTIESIYVPDDLVSNYQSATYWKSFASKIIGISNYTEESTDEEITITLYIFFKNAGSYLYEYATYNSLEDFESSTSSVMDEIQIPVSGSFNTSSGTVTLDYEEDLTIYADSSCSTALTSYDEITSSTNLYARCLSYPD